MFTLVLQSLSKLNPCTLLLSSFSVRICWLVLLPQHCCNCLTTDLIASVFVSNSQGTLKTRLVSQFFLNCTPQHMAFAMTKVLSKHSNDSSLSLHICSLPFLKPCSAHKLFKDCPHLESSQCMHCFFRDRLHPFPFPRQGLPGEDTPYILPHE